MRDKKFVFAVLIIVVLACALLYLVFIGPKIEGYVVNKQVQAQQMVVKAIIQQANQQGYVQLFDGETNVLLIKQELPKQTAVQSTQNNAEAAE